jgi:DNA-binding transcriptional regulator LsrR (DeoR family)
MRMERAGLASGSSFRAPLTLATLADLLGMTLEHVSRLMQRLRRNGLIRTDRELIEIVDIEALAKACDFDPSYLHVSENPKPLQRES